MDVKKRVLLHINGNSGIQLHNLFKFFGDIDQDEIHLILATLLKEGEIQEVPGTKDFKWPRYYPKTAWLPSSTKLPSAQAEAQPLLIKPKIVTATEDPIAKRVKAALVRFESEGVPFTEVQLLDSLSYEQTALQRRPELQKEVREVIARTNLKQRQAVDKAIAKQATGKPLKVPSHTQLPYRAISSELLQELRDTQLAVEQSSKRDLVAQDKAIAAFSEALAKVGKIIKAKHRNRILDWLDYYYRDWRALYKAEQPTWLERQATIKVRELRHNWAALQERLRKDKKMILVYRAKVLVAALVPVERLETLSFRSVESMGTGYMKQMMPQIWETLKTTDAIVLTRRGQPVAGLIAPRVLFRKD